MAATVLPFTPQAEQDAGPRSVETEQALLGAILMHNELWFDVAGIVAPEHLTEDAHQRIFSQAGALIAAGHAATPITLKAYLGDADLGGLSYGAYMARLVAEAVGWQGAVGYARTIRDLAVRRAMIAAGENLARVAREAGFEENVGTLIDEAETDLLQARADVPRTHMARQSAAEGADWMLDRIRSIRNGETEVPRIPTGLTGLDRALCGGFGRGHLVLIAGRPGMGKTVVMTTLSRQIARQHGVLVFQLEVPKEQQYARWLADLAYSPARPMTFGQIEAARDLDDEAMWSLEHAHKQLARLHLELEVESCSVAQIAASVKQAKRRFAKAGAPLGVVFIDYLKFVKVSDRYRGQRVLEIGEISGALKTLAKQEDICIVLLTQLNRQVEAEGRTDRRPSTADLRDSGELEQDADVVMLLYREAVYLERRLKASQDAELAGRLVDARNKLEIILGKNRGGPTDTIDLWCDVAASSIASHQRGPV